MAVSKSHHNVDSDWKAQQGNSPVNIKMRLKFGRWLLLDPTYLNGNLFEILQTFWGIQRIKNIYKSDLTNNNLSLWRWCIWPFFLSPETRGDMWNRQRNLNNEKCIKSDFKNQKYWFTNALYVSARLILQPILVFNLTIHCEWN